MSGVTAKLFIDGEFVDGAGAIEVVNPATEVVIGEVSEASEAQLNAAVASARAAFDRGGWPLLSRGERAQYVTRMLEFFEANAERFRTQIVAETGCPIASHAMATQFDGPIRQARQYLAYYLTLPEFEESGVPILDRVSASGAFVQAIKRYVPVGVVAAISAYNFPFYLNMWKVIPALMTGNAVVLRPNPLTPYSALMFGEAAAAAKLPPGVLSVVVDSTERGGVLLTQHPSVDMVSFTGSSAVGEKVAAQASSGIKRLILELGGKSAQIYLPDRLEAARNAALNVCASHSGQGCVAGTRILVPAAQKQELLNAMASALEALVIGDPTDAKTRMGPVISAAQRQRCEHYVNAAVEAGGRVVTGGKRPSHLKRGFFFQPTILDLPDNANPAAQDEIFGPVVGVIGYDLIDHAVAIANDTPFGLSGYVYGKDVRQALAVAMRVRTGTVNINSTGANAFTSSGGFGASGIGRERGLEGVRGYQQIQVLNVSN